MLSTTTVLIVLLGKTSFHLLVNKNHSEIYDIIFPFLTVLGDGVFMLTVGIIILFFIRIRYGLIILTSFLSSSLVVQILKRFVFPGHDRPVLFFEKLGIEIYRIPGIEYHSHFSFPSGHATTAFALFISIAMLSRSNIIKCLYLCLAFMVAFSRVYLSQHFFEDILAGSLLGTITALLVHFVFLKMNKSWLDNSLMKVKSGTK